MKYLKMIVLGISLVLAVSGCAWLEEQFGVEPVQEEYRVNQVAEASHSLVAYAARQVTAALNANLISADSGSDLLDRLEEVNGNTALLEANLDLCGDNFECIGTGVEQLEAMQKVLNEVLLQLRRAHAGGAT